MSIQIDQSIETIQKNSFATYPRRIFAHVVDSIIIKMLVAILCLDTAVFAKPWEAIAITYVVLVWVYYAGLESSKWQATLGKMLFGLMLIDVTGTKVSFVRASIRHMLKTISTFIFFGGYLLAFFTKKRQTLHDLISKTVVVNKSENSP